MAYAKTLVQKRKRGVFGWLVAIVFWGFNLLMLAWLVSAFGLVGEQYSSATSNAARAGTAIGAGLGISMLLGVWLIGDLILGLIMYFTRGPLVTYEAQPKH